MRGLKCVPLCPAAEWRSRIPYGMRGLKYPQITYIAEVMTSHPIRDAWIEIDRGDHRHSGDKSHPIRDAWIEIAAWNALPEGARVASHTGCVD